MQEIITILNNLFDIISLGSSYTERYIYIIFISLFSSVVFLFLFKFTSNQLKIKHNKDLIFANILQMRIYKDKLLLLILSILNIFKHNLLYIKQTIIPFMVICIPLIILTVQVNNRTGYTPLGGEESFIIWAELDTNAARIHLSDYLDGIYCQTSPGIHLETPPLRIPSERAVFWRARVVEAVEDGVGYIRVGVHGNDHMIKKEVITNDGHKRFSAVKTKWSLWSGLVNNAEGFLPNDAFIKSISIQYNRARYNFFIWSLDSLVLYLVLTLVFAFSLKSLFKVVI